MLVKAVKPRDRIKYWNIVPGDRVRIIGDKEGQVLEVFKINKLSNRVYLKGSSTNVRRDVLALLYSLVDLHASRIQDHARRWLKKRGLLKVPAVYWGFRVPSKRQGNRATYTSVCPTTFFVRLPFLSDFLSVFATRIGTSKPHWQPMGARYQWDRFAAGTTPRLPSTTTAVDRIRIPWPKRPDRPKYERMFMPPFSAFQEH